MPKVKGLTPKEAMFIIAYVNNGFNGQKACEKAGYAKKSARITASKLLTKSNIKTALDDLLKKREQEITIDPEQIKKDLVEIKDRCMQKVPVMEYNNSTKEWEETGEWSFKENGAIKAIELMMRHKNMFKDDNEAKSITVNYNDPLEKEI